MSPRKLIFAQREISSINNRIIYGFCWLFKYSMLCLKQRTLMNNDGEFSIVTYRQHWSSVAFLRNYRPPWFLPHGFHVSYNIMTCTVRLCPQEIVGTRNQHFSFLPVDLWHYLKEQELTETGFQEKQWADNPWEEGILAACQL